ncbi:MAG: hypothetical protein Q8L71_01750 [Thiobacillus sp.]|nr:hypothetical protein [Thiobacillus sp.]
MDKRHFYCRVAVDSPILQTATIAGMLALFIAFEIIEEHGGCVTVESEPGKGTAFPVRLPATSDNQGAPAPTGGHA